MQTLFVLTVVFAVFALFVQYSRNAHHMKVGDKDVYTTILPMKLALLLIPLFLWLMLILGIFDVFHKLKMGPSESWSFAFIILCLSVLSCYCGLYTIATDEKAIYYAAFLRTTIPFDKVTQIKENKRGIGYATVYSKGHIPIYVSGMLIDYRDLMDRIHDKCTQAKLEIVGNG